MPRVKLEWLALGGLALALSSSAAYGRAIAARVIDAHVAWRHPEVATISPARLDAQLAAGRAPLLIDTRSYAEYATSHLPGARWLSASSLAVERLAAHKTRLVVTYCSVGYRSARVASALARDGFEQVRDLQGGIFAWANRGSPVFRGAQRAHRVHPYDGLWGLLLAESLRAPP